MLRERGFNANCLNGDMRQSERNQIMARFRSGENSILVATDVASRGIDVLDVDAVFNYEIPLENEYYLHRIGRTGRAKKEGVSYIFYGRDELPRLRPIIRYTRSREMCIRDRPSQKRGPQAARNLFRRRALRQQEA